MKAKRLRNLAMSPTGKQFFPPGDDEPQGLMWRLEQTNNFPGVGVDITQGESFISFSQGSGFAPNMYAYAYSSGDSNRPIYNVPGSGFAIYCSMLNGEASDVDGITPNDNRLVADIATNNPTQVGPTATAWPSTFSFPLTGSVTFGAAKIVSTAIENFFRSRFWANAMPSQFFQSIVNVGGAGANGARNSKEWTCPDTGEYLLKFRVPGKENNFWGFTYDILIQDAEDSNFHSLIQIGGSDFQETFLPADDEQAVNRGAVCYHYKLRMNKGQKLRLILRRVTQGAGPIEVRDTAAFFSIGPDSQSVPSTLTIRYFNASIVNSGIKTDGLGEPGESARVGWDSAYAGGAGDPPFNPGEDVQGRLYWLELYQEKLGL